MTDKEKHLLAIVDDDHAVRDSLAEMLKLEGFDTAIFTGGADILSFAEKDKFSCFIIDVLMPGLSGIDLLKELIKQKVPGPVVVVTGHGDIGMAVDAMRIGAYDFIEKPFDKEKLLSSLRRAVEKFDLIHETCELKEKLRLARDSTDDDFGILGDSDAVRKVREAITTFADTDATALITGETGSGKELVAQALHKKSGRGKKRFVAVNMASLPETLAMSELFGHAKGSFTGAASSREGKFEYADGGSILLDEINSSSPAIQAGILRAIENKVVERLGENKSISVDVRIIASSNRDLQELVSKKEFREDLYYRLKMISIHIPPLRKRTGDIPILAASFIKEACSLYSREPITLAPVVLQKMVEYGWPGNVRELKHTITSLVIDCRGDEITRWNLSGKKAGEPRVRSLKESVNGFELKLVGNALDQTRGNLKLAAEILEIPQRTLYDKMQKFGLTKENFK